ncbi:hypothetical protein D779_1453 [Imhoffiella purpurea]|uniref:Large ribosomal RNA subunit accumulation protein YceD n=1 Tax=Imhoffiella purpurea TaxID=1249627 RepID=W9VH50_9GAMM|nr:hypothetical protein D779_1453 [Imhoffiella purpurea]
MALVRTERAASELVGEYEVLVVEDDSMRPLDLIEDELLLAIPIVPRHAPGACLPPETTVEDGGLAAPADGVPETETGARHPFAVLAALRRESDTLN